MVFIATTHENETGLDKKKFGNTVLRLWKNAMHSC